MKLVLLLCLAPAVALARREPLLAFPALPPPPVAALSPVRPLASVWRSFGHAQPVRPALSVWGFGCGCDIVTVIAPHPPVDPLPALDAAYRGCSSITLVLNQGGARTHRLPIRDETEMRWLFQLAASELRTGNDADDFAVTDLSEEETPPSLEAARTRLRFLSDLQVVFDLPEPVTVEFDLLRLHALVLRHDGWNAFALDASAAQEWAILLRQLLPASTTVAAD